MKTKTKLNYKRGFRRIAIVFIIIASIASMFIFWDRTKELSSKIKICILDGTLELDKAKCLSPAEYCYFYTGLSNCKIEYSYSKNNFYRGCTFENDQNTLYLGPDDYIIYKKGQQSIYTLYNNQINNLRYDEAGNLITTLTDGWRRVELFKDEGIIAKILMPSHKEYILWHYRTIILCLFGALQAMVLYMLLELVVPFVYKLMMSIINWFIRGFKD